MLILTTTYFIFLLPIIRVSILKNKVVEISIILACIARFADAKANVVINNIVKGVQVTDCSFRLSVYSNILFNCLCVYLK
jgi:hypothetical protein